MNKATEKIKRNFLSLSPEKREEALTLLLKLANEQKTERLKKQYLGIHFSLKKLNEEQLSGGQENEQN